MMGADKNRELALMILWQGAECLIQDRTHQPEGGLGFWGGRLKENEAPIDAAIREAGEEIGEQIGKELSVPGVVTEMGEPIEDDGWLINSFQASLKYNRKVKAAEGVAIRMSPLEMWENKKLMPASRAVLREIILKPYGIIDN